MKLESTENLMREAQGKQEAISMEDRCFTVMYDQEIAIEDQQAKQQVASMYPTLVLEDHYFPSPYQDEDQGLWCDLWNLD